MQNASDKIFNQTQKVSLLDFERKYAEEIMQIQAETGLSFWSKEDYLNQLGREDTIFKIVRNSDENVIGFVLVKLLRLNSDSFDSAEVFNIAVRKTFQKQGIGQMIFDETLRLLEERNIKEICLEVRESNLKAIAFYQKNGFKKQFERKNYYSNPTENALILKRNADTLVRLSAGREKSF